MALRKIVHGMLMAVIRQATLDMTIAPIKFSITSSLRTRNVDAHRIDRTVDSGSRKVRSLIGRILNEIRHKSHGPCIDLSPSSVK